MTSLSRREFHVTNAEEQRAIVVKIFGTTYINMAFVVLLAYGFVPNEPKLLVQASILNGEYSDFNSDWYANVSDDKCDISLKNLDRSLSHSDVRASSPWSHRNQPLPILYLRTL